MAADDQKPFDTPQALSPDLSGRTPQSSSPSSPPAKGTRKIPGSWPCWILGLYVLAIFGFVLAYFFMSSIGLVGLIRKGLGGLFFFGLGVTVLIVILRLNVPNRLRRGKTGGGPADGKAAAASGRRWRISSP
ncbi:MAG: hypothetical protein ACFNOM_04825 [Parascardovia denticolens]